MRFDAALESWHDFYLICGGAAAALAGLLFVGLSIHLRAVISETEVRGLARVTLTNFTLLLLVALFLTIPASRPAGTGIELLVIGGSSVVITTPRVVAGIRQRSTLRLLLVLYRFGLSWLAYLGLVAIGVLFVLGDYEDALSWLVAVVAVLFLLSIRNTWDLLVTVGEATGADRQG
jgi:modulator of FtsH protease